MATYRGEDQTAQLFIWLRLHGANPDEVPLDEDMTISTDDNGVRWLHWSQFALINGGRYINPWNTGAAVEKHKTRLVSPPPDWWEPLIHPTREQLLEAAGAVLQLHRGVEHQGQTICAECSALDEQGTTDNAPAAYPCGTAKALACLPSITLPLS